MRSEKTIAYDRSTPPTSSPKNATPNRRKNSWKKWVVPTRRKALWYFFFFSSVLIAKVIWVWAVYHPPEQLLNSSAAVTDDFMARRHYLIEKSLPLTPSQMPSWIPPQFQGEWAVGTLSMVTAALTNLSFLYPEIRAESIEHISFFINKLSEKEFRQFDEQRWNEDPLDSIAGSNGHIGYLGHLAWMLSAYVLLGGAEPSHLRTALVIESALVERFSRKKLLQTYPGETYIPDNVVALAALANFARWKRQPFRYRKQWIQYARAKLLDPTTGLLGFSVGEKGLVTGARGSGAGWNSFYLPYIDTTFAKEQFARLKQHLYVPFAKIAGGIREYPKGVEGSGDIDSGPIVFGLSPSGTGFAIAGARWMRDEAMLGGLLLTSELVGFTYQKGFRRYYLTAPLVGEAIVLAMKSMTLWDRRFVGQVELN